MAKFIEVHGYYDTEPALVNLDWVAGVGITTDGFAVLTFGGEQSSLHVKETYEQVRLLIGSAQGGIPMDPSKMY